MADNAKFGIGGAVVIPPASPAPSPAYLSFMADVNPITAQGLMGVIGQQIQQGRNEIHLMLSTGGGTVREGLAIYNLLRALPVRVFTYNTGSVNSIGNVIYLAGEKRFASPVSSFMFHGVGCEPKGRLEEKNLKELTASLKSDQSLISEVIVRHTTIDKNTVDRLFLEAAFIGADDARGRGIVHEVCDIKVPQGAPFFQLVFQR